MSANKKIYISLAVFGAVSFCFVFLVFLPALEQIEKSGEETALCQQTIHALKIRQATLSRISEEHCDLEEKIEKIEGLFLDPENPPQALNLLEESAEAAGVEISASALSFSEEDEPWPYFSVKVSLTSDFSGIMRFIDGLENSSGLVEIENPSFGKTGDSVRASFSVKIFTR